MDIERARFGHPTLEQKLLWAPLYERVLNLLGPTGVIIPMGDTNHENAGRTICTTVGEEQVAFTYSEAITDWDTPPTFLGPARIPIITFNGTNEEADTPDVGYWTRALAPFSAGAWVNFSGGDATLSTVLAKFTAGNFEWFLLFDAADKLKVSLYDEDDAVTPNAAIVTLANAAISSTAWVFIAATYDGSADASGINLYQDGAVIASTDTDDVNFASMRDTTSLMRVGARETGATNLFDGKMAGGPLGPFFTQTELSADAVKRLYQLGRPALNV